MRTKVEDIAKITQLSKTRITESPRRNLTQRKMRAISIGQIAGLGGRGRDVHLAHETILVHTLPLAALGLLSPHLLDILQHHVAVSVKGLDAGQQLAVVAAGDQDLGVRAGGGLQKGQRAGGELMFLD